MSGVRHFVWSSICDLTSFHFSELNVQLLKPIVLVRLCRVSPTTPLLLDKCHLQNRRAQEVVGVHHYLWLSTCGLISSRLGSLLFCISAVQRGSLTEVWRCYSLKPSGTLLLYKARHTRRANLQFSCGLEDVQHWVLMVDDTRRYLVPWSPSQVSTLAKNNIQDPSERLIILRNHFSQSSTIYLLNLFN